MRAEVFLASAVMLHLVGRGARSIYEGRAQNAENLFSLEDCFPKHAQTLLFELKGARKVSFCRQLDLQFLLNLKGCVFGRAQYRIFDFRGERRNDFSNQRARGDVGHSTLIRFEPSVGNAKARVQF